MKYTIDKQSEYTVFTLGEKNLNSLIAPKLKSELFILSQEGVDNLIFDMRNIEFIDSSGLSALLNGNRLWDKGRFIVSNIQSDFVKNLINISRIDTILNIADSPEEAKAMAIGSKQEDSTD